MHKSYTKISALEGCTLVSDVSDGLFPAAFSVPRMRVAVLRPDPSRIRGFGFVRLQEIFRIFVDSDLVRKLAHFRKHQQNKEKNAPSRIEGLRFHYPFSSQSSCFNKSHSTPPPMSVRRLSRSARRGERHCRFCYPQSSRRRAAPCVCVRRRRNEAVSQ